MVEIVKSLKLCNVSTCVICVQYIRESTKKIFKTLSTKLMRKRKSILFLLIYNGASLESIAFGSI